MGHSFILEKKKWGSVFCGEQGSAWRNPPALKETGVAHDTLRDVQKDVGTSFKIKFLKHFLRHFFIVSLIRRRKKIILIKVSLPKSSSKLK